MEDTTISRKHDVTIKNKETGQAITLTGYGFNEGMELISMICKSDNRKSYDVRLKQQKS